MNLLVYVVYSTDIIFVKRITWESLVGCREYLRTRTNTRINVKEHLINYISVIILFVLDDAILKENSLFKQNFIIWKYLHGIIKMGKIQAWM